MKYVVDLKDGFVPYESGDTVMFPGKPKIGIFDGKYYSEEEVNEKVEAVRKNAYMAFSRSTSGCLRDEGRDEAWNLVRTLAHAECDGGFSDRDLKLMFGTEDPWNIICNHSYQEVSEAIREYKSPNIGDLVVVTVDDAKETGIVVGCDNGEYSVLFADGRAEYYLPDEFEKTGDHSDIMCSLLKTLKGEARNG